MPFVQDDLDNFHSGHDDAISMLAFDWILAGLPSPTLRGKAWAEWLPGRGRRVILQASYIEREADGLRVAHPRLWIVEASGAIASRELSISKAATRTLSETILLMQDSIRRAIGPEAPASEASP